MNMHGFVLLAAGAPVGWVCGAELGFNHRGRMLDILLHCLQQVPPFECFVVLGSG
jgi:hypothetical protein